MIKKIIIFTTFLISFNLIILSPALAGSRLQAIQDGVDASNGKSKSSSPTQKGKEGTISEPDDIVFLGVFQTYSPKIRKNIQLSVYGEPAKFKYAARACKNSIKIRDRINTYFYKNPPEIIKKTKVKTKGLDAGVRKAVKKALKTKREYFTSFYVVSGQYNDYKKPSELKELPIVNCATVIEQAAELAKAAKK